MKKTCSMLFILMICFSITLAGCNQNAPPSTESAPPPVESTPTSLSWNNSSHNPEECITPTYFYTFEDLKTFYETKSTDLNDYSAEWPPHSPGAAVSYHLKNQPYFLDFVEVFALNDELIQQLDHIQFYFGAVSCHFKTGLSISYSYNGSNSTSAVPKDHTGVYLSLEEAKTTQNMPNKCVAHRIEDFTIIYLPSWGISDTKLCAFEIVMQVNGFRIIISMELTGDFSRKEGQYIYPTADTIEELLSDPIHADVAPFFTEGAAREDAFFAMKDVIDKYYKIG